MRERRAVQLEEVLRVGLHSAAKRKTPSFSFPDDATRAALRLETHGTDRRSRLKLRDGLPRCLPKCVVPMEPLPMTQSRDSDWSHVTPVEGIPEKWMEPPQKVTSEFCFTPIEGVLERMTIDPPSSRRMTVFSDVEGIPERQWVIPNGYPHKQSTHLDLKEGRGSTSHPEQRLSYQAGATQESHYEHLGTILEASLRRHSGRAGADVGARMSQETVEGGARLSLESPPINVQYSPQPAISHRSEISLEMLQPEISQRSEIVFAEAPPSEHSAELEQTIIQNVSTEHPPDFKRSSLLGSDMGMQWVNGCRRSQRNRCKPLRWWDGEHKVYGRQHNTLATVTGYVTKSPKPEWPRPSPKPSRTKRSK